ncbi:MAG TPA: hypothetical protein VE861_00510, partial [Gemmatimonadaceae bacterium]|nr:hypothetical protein [Gemmatimonadaceae bacterium]
MPLRVIRFALLASVVLLCTACYTYVPSGNAPASGREVAIVLTDKGRVALSDRVGPEIDQLRGRLMSSTDTSVVLSMSESVSLRGVSAKWTDEVVTLSRDHFGSVRIKELSRGRTAVAAGVAGAAVVLVILNRTIGLGSDGVTQEPSDPRPMVRLRI